MFIDALAPMIRSSTTSSSSAQCPRHLKRILAADPHALLSSVEDQPFNLVPIGSPVLLIKTHALSSNLTTLPSGLCSFFFVRTTTACLISPRRTWFASDVDTLP